MYASFFGLRELPFNNTPDPRFFFSTPDHEEALASLIYAIAEGKGFVVLTGEVGAGKTLVTRLMLRHFGTGIAFASVNNSQVNANELLHTVCSEFNIDAPSNATNVELTRMLQDFLLSSFAMNKPVVLMLDEAQALTREAFEQIRMIGNLEADDAKLLQIVIVGQPELKEMFEANDMRQLRQRLFRSFHLGALTRSQTEGYIFHRLSVAGATFPEKILSASAIDAIYDYSQGLPRLINTLCDNAMLSSYAADTNEIDGPFIKNVIAQMMTVAQGGSKFASPRVNPPANWQSHQPATRWETESTSSRMPAASPQTESIEFDRRIHAPVTASEIDSIGTPELIVAEVNPSTGSSSTGSGDSAQMRRLAVLVRRLLAETKTATEDVRTIVSESKSARQAAEKTLSRLSEQTARTGRLTISLRNVFDNLENRARRLAQRSGDDSSNTDNTQSNTTGDVTRRRTNSKSFDQALMRNRRSLDEIRSMIESARKGDSDSDAESPSKTSPSSDLAKQVRELADMCRGATLSKSEASAR
jgi:type II secretory pathway predicted ATPase ExeA